MFQVTDSKKKNRKNKKENIQPNNKIQIQKLIQSPLEIQRDNKKIDIITFKDNSPNQIQKYPKKEPYSILSQTTESLTESKGKNKTPIKVISPNLMINKDSPKSTNITSCSKSLNSNTPELISNQNYI